MNENFMFRMDQNLQDLNPIAAGEGVYSSEDPAETQSWEHHLLHYVRCGHGFLRLKGKTYPVHAGQIFLICPGESAYFHPDKGCVWALRWVGFNGALAHRFSELPPVFDAPDGTFYNLCDLKNSPYAVEYKLASELFFLHAALLQPQRKKLIKDYVQWVMDYIQNSYMHPITVANIAEQVGLNVSYISRQFKKRNNLSIQGYILQTRCTRAMRYLELGYSIKETASLCGFNDASSFCKTFKKYDPEGRSPSQWAEFIISCRKDLPVSSL